MWLTLLGNKWLWIALALAALTLAVTVQTKRLHSAQAQVVAVQARFDVFVEQTKAIGEAQIAKNKEAAAKQERNDRESKKSADARVAAILDRYNRLLNRPAGSGGGSLPPIPSTSRPTDDAARDQRILEVLRAADLQTATLIELQEWIRQIPR